MIRKYALYLAWLIATLATLGSLYFSEIRHLEPCHLCWYQRICLYPLVIILWIASFRAFFGIASYVLPQVILGGLLASYQIVLQEIPGWEPIRFCGKGPDCAEKINIGLGSISLPMLSLAVFVLIFFLLLFAWIAGTWGKRKENPETM